MCLGERGKKRAIVKEYKIVKRKEAQLKAQEFDDIVSGELQKLKTRISSIEKTIDDNNIVVNMQG